MSTGLVRGGSRPSLVVDLLSVISDQPFAFALRVGWGVKTSHSELEGQFLQRIWLQKHVPNFKKLIIQDIRERAILPKPWLLIHFKIHHPIPNQDIHIVLWSGLSLLLWLLAGKLTWAARCSLFFFPISYAIKGSPHGRLLLEDIYYALGM